MLILLATCWLGAGEIAALGVKDVDWDWDLLRVFRTKTGRRDLFR